MVDAAGNPRSGRRRGGEGGVNLGQDNQITIRSRLGTRGGRATDLGLEGGPSGGGSTLIKIQVDDTRNKEKEQDVRKPMHTLV